MTTRLKIIFALVFLVLVSILIFILLQRKERNKPETIFDRIESTIEKKDLVLDPEAIPAPTQSQPTQQSQSLSILKDVKLLDSSGEEMIISEDREKAIILIIGCEGCGAFFERMVEFAEGLSKKNPDTIEVYALYKPSPFDRRPSDIIQEQETLRTSLEDFESIVGEKSSTTFVYYHNEYFDDLVNLKGFPHTIVIFPDGTSGTISGYVPSQLLELISGDAETEPLTLPSTEDVASKFKPKDDYLPIQDRIICPEEYTTVSIHSINSGVPTEVGGRLSVFWTYCNADMITVSLKSYVTNEEYEVATVPSVDGKLITTIDENIPSGLYDLRLIADGERRSSIAERSVLILEEA